MTPVKKKKLFCAKLNIRIQEKGNDMITRKSEMNEQLEKKIRFIKLTP